MRLDVASFDVTEIAFGDKTELAGGTLVIDKQELKEQLLDDPAFADVKIDLARPGESSRIVHVFDVVEPRWKVEGPGNVFPGFVGPPTTVGQGRTNALSGAAVVVAGGAAPGEPVYWREGIVDMSGPGAVFSPFSQLRNVVLTLIPSLDFFPAQDGAGANLQATPQVVEYYRAVHAVGCKAAAYLARAATAGKTPSRVETVELGPCDPSLPKVACVYQTSRPRVYGTLAQLHVGTLLHPNESFDGAIMTGAGSPTTLHPTLYMEQNNGVLMELCRRHGKELNFVGYIVFGGNTSTNPEKERMSSSTSNLVRLLGAEAAVFMGQSDSNATVDSMLTVQKCEQMGIKTTIIYKEVGKGNDDPGFVHFVPEADAIVNVGSREQEVTLPPVEALVGGERLLHEDVDAAGEFTTSLRYIVGANNLLGMNYLVTELE